MGRILPVALLVAFAGLCATSLLEKSATYDESHYLGVGTHALHHGISATASLPKGGLHPPLSSWIHGLPLLAAGIPEEIWGEPHADLRGQRIIDLRSDDWNLNGPRLAMLPLGLLLGWLVFIWSRRLYGAWGGALSLSLFAFDPNLIAHARLITPDVTLACATVFCAYRLWRFAETRSPLALGLAGFSVGLLLLSKHTSLALVPILAVTDVVFRLRTEPEPITRFSQGIAAARHWPALLAIGFGMVWVAYGCELGPLQLSPQTALPFPAPTYFQGAIHQFLQSQVPHDFYILGSHSQTGWWWFYLAVVALKVPIAITGLVIAASLMRGPLGLRFDARELYLWLPFALFFVYLSLFNTIHNGLRYLLPVYPLALIGVGKLVGAFAGHRWLRGVVAGAVAWVAASSLWIWPDYLAYTTEWSGGPRHAYRWLADSNLDWGQDLKQLKRYLDEHGIERIRLAYFGTADPSHYGIDYDPLPMAITPIVPPGPRSSKPAPAAATWVALSAYQYHGVGFANKDQYAFFHDYEPNDQVGYSILLFDLDDLKPRD